MHPRIEARLLNNLVTLYPVLSQDEIKDRVAGVFQANRAARNEFVINSLNPEITKRYGNRTTRP